MEQIKLSQAAVLASPNPVTVVCTEKPEGTTNLATVSWWSYLSFNPEMTAYAVAKTSSYINKIQMNIKSVFLCPLGAV